MSSLAVQPVTPVVVCPHATALGAVLRRLGVSLLVACGIPAALFYTTYQTLGMTPAILAALTWSYAAIGWRRLTRRPMSGLLALTVTVLTIRTIFTLSTGNTFVYFLQPMVSDGVVALVFLASLASARPLVSRLASDFYPMSPDLAAHPRVRRLFRRLTVMWGAVLLLKAAVGVWLLESLSVGTFVLVKDGAMMTITAVAVLVTVVAALVVLRHDSVVETA